MYDEHGDGGIGDSPRVTFGRSHQARYTKLVDSEQVEVGYVTPPPVNSSRPPISETGTLFEADPQDYIVAADGQHPQGVVAEEVVKEEPKPLRLVIFVTIAMFMGYAILVSFQHKLKVRLNIKDDGSQRSHVFSVGVSMQYIGNLIFRMAHNFIFFFIKPRHRVYLSMIAMGIAMFLLGVLVFALDIDHLAIIFVAYGLGGVGIGSFESNLLSAITPLGHQTKVWAIIGFPVGFACVLIGGFMLTAIGVPTQAIYLIVCGAIIAAAALFFFMVPVIEVKNNAQTLRSFIDNVKHIREWFPQIAFHSFALMVDMFFVSLFSGIMLYIYNDNNYVPIFGENSSVRVQVPRLLPLSALTAVALFLLFVPCFQVLMSHDWYFVVYNFFTLCGDR